MSIEKITINTLSNGAVNERIQKELQKVLNNISDPNTEPKASRELVIKIQFKPDEGRGLATLDTQVSSKLAPPKKIKSALLIGQDGEGMTVAREVIKQAPGQMFIDNDSQITDTKPKNVVDGKDKFRVSNE